MIDSDKSRAVYRLHEEGMSVRQLARQLRMSRKSVRKIVAAQGNPVKISRRDTKRVDEAKIQMLFKDCQGFIQRVHEKLEEEEGIEIGYSTLTRLVRSMGLSDDGKKDHRDASVPDKPGDEMQHDTSSYELELGPRVMKVQGSSLYLRYSKMRYLKFYPSFNRFRMKCFFHEALHHFEYVAETCIIDNTNLAVLRGTGENAIMNPEMIAFTKNYCDFKWKAHAAQHSDRKGGVESGFWFVETNFFPGRKFESLEDLNAQAMEWATRRIPLRPHAKTKLIPAQLFELEKSSLKKLPPYVSPPTLYHERETDQYGYAAFDGNYYWIPGTGRGKVQVVQFAEKIQILRNRECLEEYALPIHGVKNERFRPAGIQAPRYYPGNSKGSTETEEKRLKAIDPSVAAYLEFIAKTPESSVKKHRLIRELFSLSLKVAPQLFIQTIQRAHNYRITDRDTIERIAIYLMRDNTFEEAPIVGDDYEERDIYREGRLSPEPDLSKYDALLQEKDEENRE